MYVQNISLAVQGKAVWSLDDEMISCLAASESRGEVVLGRSDGAIQFWTVGDWSLRGTFNSTNAICRLMYGSIRKSALPNTFLLVSLTTIIMHLSLTILVFSLVYT